MTDLQAACHAASIRNIKAYVLSLASELGRGPHELAEFDLELGSPKVVEALTGLADDNKIALLRNDDNLARGRKASEVLIAGEPRHLLYVK